jgi:hypothetical protein
MQTYHNTALVFGSLKDALLHYEYVIPMNFTGQFMGLRPSATGSIEKIKDPGMDDYHELGEVFGEPDQLLKLYPPNLAAHPYFKSAVHMFDGFLFSYMVKTSLGEDIFKSYIDNLSQVVGSNAQAECDQLCPTAEGLQRLFGKLVKDFKLSDMPVDCSGFRLVDSIEIPDTNALTIHKIPMVNTEEIGFSQIMEFRRDSETMKKMRNFRLFAYEQYAGKDKAFVEDDIQRRYEDYLEAVRVSGFVTTTKMLTSLISSKLLMGSLATSAASLLLGNTQLAIGAFSSGAILEIGKLSFEFALQKQAIATICRDNPISYIAEATDKLKDSMN